MAAKGLTEAWRGAEAAKPSDWTIRGVVLGPREVDPRVSALALRLRELEA